MEESEIIDKVLKAMPYQNREIDERFKDFADQLNRMEQGNNEKLTRIEIQTTKTNGKVADLQAWRYITVGGLAVLTVVVTPILSWALIRLANLDSTVRLSVDQALSN